MSASTCTQTWFDLFRANHDPSRTAREADVLTRVLPPPPARILDVWCGYGRHAHLLAEAGYEVLGIDRDDHAVERARALHDHPRATFLVHDMTRIGDLPGPFDGITCMWQSFGYHDDATNAGILRQMARQLTPGGRIVLDIYNRDFFACRQGGRATTQQGIEIVTRQHLHDDRLIVDLDYRDEWERFDWQVFTPKAITRLAATLGLKRALACASFDERQPPSPDTPRMQLVFAGPANP